MRWHQVRTPRRGRPRPTQQPVPEVMEDRAFPGDPIHLIPLVLGGSGAIVACESGGQNLTPNSAGASGFYQIIPGTWREFGGTGPAAYLASKAEQDRVASRIWSGAGWQAWDCARMLGIH